jgi:HPt (histidine-containing phosphotransfer) domain-containing protein
MSAVDREDVLSVAGILLDSLPKDIYRLESALAVQDFKEIAFVAHSLKGVAGVFSANRIIKLGVDLEQASKDEDVVRTKEISAQFIHELRVLLAGVEVEMA